MQIWVKMLATDKMSCQLPLLHRPIILLIGAIQVVRKCIIIFLSRYVLGHEAMKKMAVSNVLICGLKGLGVEIGKLNCTYMLWFKFFLGLNFIFLCFQGKNWTTTYIPNLACKYSCLSLLLSPRDIPQDRHLRFGPKKFVLMTRSLWALLPGCSIRAGNWQNVLAISLNLPPTFL